MDRDSLNNLQMQNNYKNGKFSETNLSKYTGNSNKINNNEGGEGHKKETNINYNKVPYKKSTAADRSCQAQQG